jgi:predicted PurR-regulated permease PerM
MPDDKYQDESTALDHRAVRFACRVTVAVLITILLLATSYLLWCGVHVLLEAFAGTLLALLLCTLSEWLSRRTGLRYGWSLAAVLVLLLAFAAGVGWLLAARLSSQLTALTQHLPKSLAAVRDYLNHYESAHRLIERSVPAAASNTNEFSRGRASSPASASF